MTEASHGTWSFFPKNLRKILLSTCFFLAVLSLRCCPGFSLVVMRGLLVVWLLFLWGLGSRVRRLEQWWPAGSRA